jgi:hypothetical protein
MSGRAESCSAELTPAAKVTVAAPRGTRIATASGRLGAAAATSASAPNASAAPTRSRGAIRDRVPVASAPATEPIPIATASAV